METIIQHIALDLVKKITKKAYSGGINDIDALASDNGNIEEACTKAKISPERYYKAKQVIEDSEYNN